MKKIEAKKGHKLKLLSASDDAIEYEEVKSREVWKPEIGDKVYILWSQGVIQATKYLKNDIDSLLQGNVFKTREEAELERDSRAKLQEIRLAIQEEWIKHDWEPDAHNTKWFLSHLPQKYLGIFAWDIEFARPAQDCFPKESAETLRDKFKPEEWALAYLKVPYE